MIKADKLFKGNLLNILRDGTFDENPRPKYESDGEPAYSKYVTQVFEKYDISKGEFPIQTIRPIGIKSSINEILAIYQTQTNTQEGFESHSVRWWKNWINEEGNIGRAYSYNLESHRPNEMKREVIRVPKRILDESEYQIKDIGLINEIQESIDGLIYESGYREYGQYIIIDKFTRERKSYFVVQFLNNGYITTVRTDSLARGQHPKNNFTRTLNNVGYLGDFKEVPNYTENEVKKLNHIWSRMIRRCYDRTRKHYDNVYVSSSWQCFETFLRDIKYIPQYHLAKEDNFDGWHLDKDYHGSNCYSKDTCVFLTTKENTTYRDTQINPVEVYFNNEKFLALTYMDIAEKFSITKSTANRWVKNGHSPNKKAIFKTINVEDGYVYRYELSRNQINSLLYNLINDKYSRRHIVSFWNWSNIDKKMLVECAFETHWTVRKARNGISYLDMTLIQRSSDYIIAGHINKLQYVALLMMVAHHCGYQVGQFSHFVQNLHIYDRQEDIAYELLNKTESIDIQPKLILNADSSKTFYDITIDDFEIANYEEVKKQKQYKFDLGV